MTELPDPLDSDKVEAQVLKTEIWNRINVGNQHYMAAIVGPEGSGKSWTSLKIAELIDPSFDADRVMFDPHSFMEQLTAWKDAGETRGKMIVVDEAGVGIGSRSWYDKDQIQLNKVLQVIRSENMGMIFTLPRLSELDSQTRGRLRAMIKMDNMKPGHYADVRYLRWQPARDERSKVYRKYPILRNGPSRKKIRRLRFGPPSQELVQAYESRKDTFQEQLYEDTTEQIGDDEDETNPVKEIANEIYNDCLNDYVMVSASNKMEYIDKDLIAIDFDLSENKANQVKKLLERKRDTHAEATGTA